MKLKTSFLSFACLILLGSLLSPYSRACTIFSAQGATTHYFASNEDWTMTDPAMHVVPSKDGNYGYIVFGWASLLPRYPQGGVNEHGLCLDWAALSPQSFKANPSRKQLNEDIIYKILRTCKNVDEVVRLVEQYNWAQFAEEHLLVADSQGDSCVIEWSDNNYKFLRKDKPYQVITNFSLANPKIGWYPCQRFDTVDGYLKKAPTPEIGVETVRDLLNKSHQEGQYPTVYSYIVDQKSLNVFVYYRHDYSKPFQYNFYEEVKKGEHRIRIY